MTPILTEERVLKAIKRHRGLVSEVAKSLKCHRSTIYNYRDNYPAVREALEWERTSLVDRAEKAISKLVDEDNVQAATLVLKTIGKGRGWTEHPEALDLPFDLAEMVEVMNLLIRSGLSVEEFMARARMLAEQRLAQMGQVSIEAPHDAD